MTHQRSAGESCLGAWLATIALGLSLAACGGGGSSGAGSAGSSGGSGTPSGGSGNPPPPAALSLFAGNMGGRGNQDGSALVAHFDTPTSIAVGADGTMYVADSNNSTIRRISPAGLVTTYAGIPGTFGSTDGASATATFNYPTGVAVDAAGNVYVADGQNQTIRKISASGIVTTLAGSPGAYGTVDGQGSAARFSLCDDLGCHGGSMAVDAAGNLYVRDSSTIRKISPGGNVITLTDGHSPLSATGGVAIDSSNNIYYIDQSFVRKVSPNGVVTTLAGVAGSNEPVDGAAGTGAFGTPEGLSVDAHGTVYVGDAGFSASEPTLRMISLAGRLTTLAGNPSIWNGGSSDGTGNQATFRSVAALAIDPSGNVIIADADNEEIRRMTPAGVVTTLAGSAGPRALQDGVGTAARFSGIMDMVQASDGALFVADDALIRRIAPDGTVTTFAGSICTCSSVVDGTGTAAQFVQPNGLTIDASDNLYVADFAVGQSIRKVTPAAVVTTQMLTLQSPFIGSVSAPLKLSMDPSGYIFIANQGNLISEVGPTGLDIGIATATEPNEGMILPQGILADGKGGAYVADTLGCIIRHVAPDHTLTAIAGSFGQCGFADGAPADARFNRPYGMALDAKGNLYVADTDNGVIRKIDTSGQVSTVVGTPGVQGFLPGALPGVLLAPTAIVLQGHTMYISSKQGVVVARDVP